MRIFFTICYVIGALVVKNSVSGKTLIFSKYSNGANLDARKQDNIAFDTSKENLEDSNQEEALISTHKRSVDDAKAFKRDAFQIIRKRSPYGLVYNQGKPIGILEPIAQSFEYAAYSPKESQFRNNVYKSQWFPVKRESDVDTDEMDKDLLESETSALHSIKHRPYQDYLNSQAKRAITPEISRRKDVEEMKKRGAVDMGNLKENLKSKENNAEEESQNKASVSKIDEIEENLKDVMGDMGLVEKDKLAENKNQPNLKKREIYFEDEDLENGLNKIGLSKDSHFDRNKKEDCPGKTRLLKSRGSRKFAMEKSFHRRGKKKLRKDDNNDAKRSVKANRKRVATKKDANVITADLTKRKVANYQYEGEDFIRRKRQGKEAEKVDTSEIMKGLETSGDLTVSGNKSPLVSVSNDDSDMKKSQEKRDKEELEYEKRLERNIQTKINTIKEEVKREIGKIKLDEAKKEQQRKKREAASNTLLDEESSVLDPGINIDTKLEPHIRKRRDVKKSETSEEKRETNKNNDNDKAVKEKRKTDSADKLKIEDAQVAKRSEETAQVIENKAKEETTLVKREAKNVDTETKAEDNAEVVKRNDQEVKAESPQIAQNSETDKKLEKRDSFIATDKLETDNKAEFGTDIPDSIVKRNDQTPQPIINKVETIASNIAKRSEEVTSATTDKCADNMADAYKKMDTETDMRQDRSAMRPSLVELQTGQTILKDIDFEGTKDSREERQSISQTSSAKSSNSPTPLEGSEKDEESEDVREERSSNKLKQENNNEDKLASQHSGRNRRGDAGYNAKISEQNAEKKISLLNPEESEASVYETKQSNMKQRDVQNENVDKLEEANVKQRSVDQNKFEVDATDASLNEKNTADANENAKAAESSLQNTEFEVDDVNDEIAIDKRRRRRTAANERLRRKREENVYAVNKQSQMLNFRADEGEIDDEDDEMQDDGFDDQSSNFLTKRNADYDNSNYENTYDQEANEDYPMLVERRKRNALRLYDDENDADEYNDNFLFYPNRYSRTKRNSYEMAIHGGGMTKHASARREQSLRRKRLEKMNRMHEQNRENENVAELAESDIFGGFPQSYEGELSRFKRVKRSTGD